MSQVLQVGPLKPELEGLLRARHQALVLPDGDRRAAFLAEHGDQVRAVVTTGHAGVPADLMGALPRLGAIVNFGVGYDQIDIGAARERSIQVSNTPDVLSDCVADTAVGLLLDVMRRFSVADRYVRAGRWGASGPFPLTRQVSGRRVGIVGLGRIGTAIATRLTGFGCRISYHNRHERDSAPYRYEASLIDMARDVDVLIVATSGGPQTQALVDRDVLTALGPDGFVVNIARGSVIDQDAMVDLLTSGGLAGAGLDVFEHEPEVPQALLGLDNVVLLPHLASGTVETRQAMADLTLANLESFLSTGKVLTPVF